MKKESMLEIANKHKRGWSFIDTGKGVTITIPNKEKLTKNKK